MCRPGVTGDDFRLYIYSINYILLSTYLSTGSHPRIYIYLFFLLS